MRRVDWGFTMIFISSITVLLSKSKPLSDIADNIAVRENLHLVVILLSLILMNSIAQNFFDKKQ